MCFPHLTLNLLGPSLFLPRIYLRDRQDLPSLEVSVAATPVSSEPLVEMAGFLTSK